MPERADRWANAGLLLLAGIVASVVLAIFTALSCVDETDSAFATYCGNAKARSYAWHGLPALAALVGGVLGITIRRRLVWALAVVLLVGATTALVLTNVLSDPPPGFGPGY